MKTRIFTLSTILLVAALCLFSCKGLDALKKFAATSEKMIERYSDINYSFTSSYYNYTLGRQTLNSTSAVEALDGTVLTVPEPDANAIRIFRCADKSLAYFQSTLRAYVEAIAKASDDDLVNYNFDDLEKALKEDSTIKSQLGITDANIEGGAKIAKVLTNKLINRYRERKLRKVIKEHASHFNNALDGFIFSLNQVRNTMINDSVSVVNNYQELLANKRFQAEKKIEWRREFISITGKISTEKRKLEILIKGLTGIKSAHNELLVKLNSNSKLKDADVADLLNNHSAKLSSLILELASNSIDN